MTTITAVSHKYFTKPQTTRRTVYKPSFLRRLRYLVEHTAWEEKALLYAARADGICLGVVIAAALYLAPILIKIFFR